MMNDVTWKHRIYKFWFLCNQMNSLLFRGFHKNNGRGSVGHSQTQFPPEQFKYRMKEELNNLKVSFTDLNMNILLKSFHMNSYTLRFRPQTLLILISYLIYSIKKKKQFHIKTLLNSFYSNSRIIIQIIPDSASFPNISTLIQGFAVYNTGQKRTSLAITPP